MRLFLFENEHLVLQTLTEKWSLRGFLFPPLFCGQQPTEIGFHQFHRNLLYAPREAQGQKGEKRVYSSPSHLSCCAQGMWWRLHAYGGICWGPASMLITPTQDRACVNDPRALFHRNPGGKIRHLHLNSIFFVSSNDTVFSTIFLQNIYNQEGIFRGIEFTLLFKLCLLFNMWHFITLTGSINHRVIF